MLPYIPESCRFLEGFRFAEESHRLWRSLESSSHARADRSCPAPPQNLPLVACEENPPCRSCRPPPQDRLAGQTHRGAPDLVHDPAAGYERGLPLPARKSQVPLRSLLAPEEHYRVGRGLTMEPVALHEDPRLRDRAAQRNGGVQLPKPVLGSFHSPGNRLISSAGREMEDDDQRKERFPLACQGPALRDAALAPGTHDAPPHRGLPHFPWPRPRPCLPGWRPGSGALALGSAREATGRGCLEAS